MLVESRNPLGEWVGRSYRDAPEIDGSVVISSPPIDHIIGLGQIVSVRVTAALPYDLIGEVRI